MRLLTKKKQNEALKRMLANANIAYNEIMKSDNFDYRIDVSNKIVIIWLMLLTSLVEKI